MARPKETSPTSKQMELYRFIVGWVCENGYQPSRREMGKAFGIGNNAVNGRLKGLEEHGLIKRTGADRAVKIIDIRWEPRPTRN